MVRFLILCLIVSGWVWVSVWISVCGGGWVGALGVNVCVCVCLRARVREHGMCMHYVYVYTYMCIRICNPVSE